jgi:hypothetical protein
MKLALALVLGLACIAGPADAHVKGGTGFFAGDAVPERMYPVVFELNANEPATVSVKGDGRGDIDCYLYKGTFKHSKSVSFLSRDTSSTDGCELTVDNASGGTYTLLVKNTTDHTEHYTGFIN